MNILLLYGGKSCEHDISIITGVLARRHFAGEVYCGYITEDNKCYLVSDSLSPVQHKGGKLNKKVNFLLGEGAIEVLSKFKRKKIAIDCAVNCCHGGLCEGGALAGLLELANIPLVGTSSISSGVAMDKAFTKWVLVANNFPVVRGELVTASSIDDGSYRKIVSDLHYPLIIKPCTLGSSIGIEWVEDVNGLLTALNNAVKYDNRLLVEEAVTDCTEYNCSAMLVGGEVQASAIDRAVSSGEILSFVDKYMTKGKSAVAVPGPIDEQLQEKISKMTTDIYKLLNLSGVVRIDYIVSEEGDLFVNEINTIPGNLAYHLWQKQHKPAAFGSQLINEARRIHDDSRHKTCNYTSSVLEGVRGYKADKLR